MRLICWDIDGTLLRGGPVARSVFADAVGRAVGRHPGDHGIAMAGKTDPQIAREIMAGMAHEATDADLADVLGHLEALLAAGARDIIRHGRVLPGVPELLERLAAEPDVVQTVVTGNIEPNARVKLAAFHLDAFLDLRVGAFGSDHADRRELVPIARRRVVEAHGSEPDDIWVVGDTPNDLACARAGRARCVLVATGRAAREELLDAGADVVLDDLADTDAVLQVLLG